MLFYETVFSTMPGEFPREVHKACAFTPWFWCSAQDNNSSAHDVKMSLLSAIGQ